MAGIICKKCGCENVESQFFCTNCGAFLKSGEFEEKQYKLPQLKMMRIIENLRNMDNGQDVIDDVFEHHAARVDELRALVALPEFSSHESLISYLDDFVDLCRHPEFQIAFVGTIKTGKSTLINALLGKNYASMAVTPETAALTKFRFSARDYVKITFYTDDEWKLLWDSQHHADNFLKEYKELKAESVKDQWLNHPTEEKYLLNDELENELVRWSSSKSPEHYFVKELEVGISTLPPDFPTQVVFVDTPGLFDPVAYRSEVTKKYIRRANAVFVCVDAQKVHQQEIETISTVLSISSNNKEKVHIVATHWDKLNHPVEDWREQKEWLCGQLTGKGFFPTEAMAAANIMHSAAYLYILCRDFDHLEKNDQIPLMQFALSMGYGLLELSAKLDEIRQKIKDESNIKQIAGIINKTLAGNYKKLLLEDVQAKYGRIQHDLKRISGDTQKEARDILEASQDELGELQKKMAEKQKNYEEIQQVSKSLETILDNVKGSTAGKMYEICAQLQSKVDPTYQRKQDTVKKNISFLEQMVSKNPFSRRRRTRR
ncbi:dynamin family protein [Megasphaera sp.]|uniref:dynamin family protein n=1 Tax=Megasphaera sp. TaxID=2023260 RepID=UPI0025FCC227|nr:dynamin family protein [uncultured Megasphaera sp.]